MLCRQPEVGLLNLQMLKYPRYIPLGLMIDTFFWLTT